MAFDIIGAKRAGYTDAEIADYLSQQTGFDASGAREAGYSDQEIIGHVSGSVDVGADNKPKSSIARRVLGDTGISALKGTIGLTESAVGLADMVSGGRAGKALEEAGYRPKQAREILDTLYSPEQQEANAAVQSAQGFVPTLKAAVQNPSTIAHAAIESAPSMIGAGGMARGIMKVAPRVAPVIAGALGEGAMSAGSTAEQVRQESLTGRITPTQTAISAGSGALTSLFGVAGGKMAQKLGIADIDTFLASGAPQQQKKNVVKAVIEGMISEGALEELPQSAQEQMAQNLALGKPAGEGVGNAAAQGMITGGLMGGGGNVIANAGPLSRAVSRVDATAVTPQSAFNDAVAAKDNLAAVVGDEAANEIFAKADAQVAQTGEQDGARYYQQVQQALSAELERAKAQPATEAITEQPIVPEQPVQPLPSRAASPVSGISSLISDSRQRIPTMPVNDGIQGAESDLSSVPEEGSQGAQKMPAVRVEDVVIPQNVTTPQGATNEENAQADVEGNAQGNEGHADEARNVQAPAEGDAQENDRRDEAALQARGVADDAQRDEGGVAADEYGGEVLNRSGDTVTLYHGGRLDAHDAIMREGIRPNKRWGVGLAEQEAARTWAQSATNSGRGEDVIYKVEVPKSEIKKIEKDHASQAHPEWRSYNLQFGNGGNLKPEWIKAVKIGRGDFVPVAAPVAEVAPAEVLKSEGLVKPATSAPDSTRAILSTLAAPKRKSDASIAKLTAAHGRDAVNRLVTSGLISFPGKGMAELTKKGRDHLSTLPRPLSPLEEKQLANLAKNGKRTAEMEAKYQGLVERAGKVAAPAASQKVEAEPPRQLQRVKASSVDTPAQGSLNAAKERKAAAWKQVKALRERIKNEPIGGQRSTLRLELLKAEDRHREAQRAESDARAYIETRANQLGQTTKTTTIGTPQYALKALPPTDSLGDFETGKPVTFKYIHNTESATKLFGKPKKDSPYDRGFEPSGRYINEVSDPSKLELGPNMVSGEITFRNPLVIKGEGWKRSLSAAFGNKRGKALSRAIIEAGYDGVVTIADSKHGKYTSEILDLTTFDETKAKYSTTPSAGKLTLSRVRSSFPNQQITEDNGTFTVTTPSGVTLRISKVGTIEFDRAAAEKAYGREMAPDEYPVAEFRALPDGAIINLTEKGVSELEHESFHAAMALSLTPGQISAILRKYGTEEKAAAEYQRLKDSGAFEEKRGNIYLAAIFRFFRNLRELIAPTAKGAMQDVASGRVWGRAKQGRGGTKYGSAISDRERDTSKRESLPDRVVADAKLLADFVDTDTFRKKGFDGFDIPTKNAQFRRVFRLVQNDKIRKAVVESIPVDMVDVLRGQKLTPEMLLHNPSMFGDLFPIDGDKPIPLLVDVADRLGSTIARVAAKIAKLPFDAASYPLKDFPAMTADKGGAPLAALNGAVEVDSPRGSLIGNSFNRPASNAGNLSHKTSSNLNDDIVHESPVNATSNTFNESDVEIKAKYSLKSAFSSHSPAQLKAAVTVHPKVQALVGSVFNNGRNVNMWMRTVGTMYHTAEKLAAEGKPQFKAVFDKGQQFLSDVSAIAMQAEALAPDLFPKMGTGKGLFHNLSRKDAQAIADPLFQGTLFGGANPVNGKVFTPAELKRIFGLNDHQIELYRQARAAVDQSLDDMAKSLIAKNAKEAAAPFDRDMELSEMAQDVTDSINTLIADKKAALDQYEKDYQDSLKTVAPDQLKALEKEHKKLTREQEATIDLYESLVQNIDNLAKKTEALKKRGYFPLMRFGEYTVTMKDKDGKVEYFGLFESAFKAKLMEDKLKKSNPSSTVTQAVMGREKFKLYGGMNLEALQLFAEHLGADETAPYQEYLKVGLNNRSAMKRLIHRKGTEGFSEDAVRTLANFIVSNARHASTQYHLHDMRKLAAEIPEDTQGDVQDQAVKLYEYLTKPREEATKLRGYLFFHYLGGSLASGIVNMTQPLMMTTPYLASKTSLKNAIRHLTMASSNAFTDPKNVKGDLGIALRRAEAEGVTAPQEIYQLTAMASNKLLASNPYANAALKAWGGFFSVAEAFNRRTTFIAAYRVAKENGKKEADAYKEATKAVTETQGQYNKGNRPNWGRGIIGAPLFTFKQFSVMYLELFNRLPKRQKAIMFGLLWFMAGLQGLPFAEDAEDIIDTIGQWMGNATNSKQWINQKAEDTLGKTAGRFLTSGVSSVLPLDLQGRFGMQNLIPATGILKQSEVDKGRDVKEWFGAAGGLLASLGDALSLAATGSYGRAVLAASPRAVQSVAQGVEMAATGAGHDKYGRKTVEVTPQEAALKMSGFNPSRIAEESQVKSANMQDINLVRVRKQEIVNQWAYGMAHKDRGEIEAAKAKLRDWNEKNPEMKIRVSIDAVARKAKNLNTTGRERFLKSMPKEMRRKAIDELG